MFLLDQSFYEFRQTDQKGRGVFCRKAVSAGVIIGDYTGTIVSYDEDDDTNGLYSMEYDDDLLILAQKDSLGIHLINHSCMPNCAIYPYADRGIFVTLRHIEVGEEFTVSYMIDPDWTETVYPCYCGTPHCRGYMTTTKRQSKAIDELSDLELRKHYPKVPLKKGDILNPLLIYPDRIEDNEIFDIYGNAQIPPHIYTGKQDLKVSEVRKIIRDSGACIIDIHHHSRIIGVRDGKVV